MEVYKYTKKALRQRALNERKLVSRKFVSTKSLLISKKLVAFLKTKNIKKIVSYKPINNEVEPNYPLLSKNYEVLFTKMYGSFLRIAKSNCFKKHNFSVLEPFCATYAFKKQIDCFIVPALVFDKRGYRIGYGMGFYDKLLQQTR
ncbi:5-formyltetrahydrofolate cyclo-ligase, partial [Desulfurella sp.]|uniref:5-formyltetrahydrofolate cyclo-ligase n=1 Tax=Desulfurella sp. TaxID=1962857 RepID=UPI003D13BE35